MFPQSSRLGKERGSESDALYTHFPFLPERLRGVPFSNVLAVWPFALCSPPHCACYSQRCRASTPPHTLNHLQALSLNPFPPHPPLPSCCLYEHIKRAAAPLAFESHGTVVASSTSLGVRASLIFFISIFYLCRSFFVFCFIT